MVDFNTLMRRSTSGETVDPIKIFENLPKSSGINNLYHVQAEILENWFSNLKDEPDVVVELNTGGGKTLVGLLMALSTMRETKEGVLYLVEIKQLVAQVVSQAVSIGIPAKPYSGRNSVDADFANGKTILVGSYQALFNGNSVFGVRGVRSMERMGGIVIDDAHASLEAVREAFTFAIPAEGSNGLYKKVLALFRDAFLSLDRSSTYQEFQEGAGNDIVGIPYSYWHNVMDRVSLWINDLTRSSDNACEEMQDSLTFNWPLIKDNLKYCQVVASRTAITISALYPLLDMVPSFRGAKRRIYMSATITDYGDMVRAYDLRNLSSEKIIAPKTSAGVGRRMMLSVPHEILKKEEFIDAILEERGQGHGVVRLASHVDVGSEWDRLSFVSPMGHDNVLQAVEQLVSGSSSLTLSLTNRYNGIDLPGDSCRVLILDDLPFGASDIDKLMEMYLADSDLILQRIAQRIEQGAGRGVRGASDHCVVLLVGHQLIDWVKRERNRGYFSEAFKAQLMIGDAISEDLSNVQDYCEVMKQDFCSDEGWKAFHASELARMISEGDCKVLGGSFDAACAERRAFAQWLEHHNGLACQKLVEKAYDLKDDRQYQGWLLYLASCIAHEGKDAKYAENLSQKAHSFNRTLPCITSPSFSDAVGCYYLRAELLCSFIDSKLLSGDVIGQFDIDTAGLSFDASHVSFEGALEMLGCYLGFDSKQADKNGEGPDVYWITQEGVAFALEAKNEKHPEKPLSKSEAGQLRTACAWLEGKCPNLEVIPVSVHPNPVAKSNASADNLFVLLPNQLKELKNRTWSLLDGALKTLPTNRADHLCRSFENEGLTAQRIIEDYLQHFESEDDN